jgi:hypothetical protein
MTEAPHAAPRVNVGAPAAAVYAYDTAVARHTRHTRVSVSEIEEAPAG